MDGPGTRSPGAFFPGTGPRLGFQKFKNSKFQKYLKLWKSSKVQRFKVSKIVESLKISKIQRFKVSKIFELLKVSKIQKFKDFWNFKNSKIQSFKNPFTYIFQRFQIISKMFETSDFEVLKVSMFLKLWFFLLFKFFIKWFQNQSFKVPKAFETLKISKFNNSKIRAP